MYTECMVSKITSPHYYYCKLSNDTQTQTSIHWMKTHDKVSKMQHWGNDTCV